jgi:hypothetical protein
VIDPRVTFYEANEIFSKVDVSKDGKVTLQEFQNIFMAYDFCDIKDKGQHLITDLKEIIKANKIDL